MTKQIQWEKFMDSGVKSKVNEVASHGRHGDSTLMHVMPEEVEILSTIGPLTRNPETGLPEAFLFFPALLQALGTLGTGIATGASAVGTGVGGLFGGGAAAAAPAAIAPAAAMAPAAPTLASLGAGGSAAIPASFGSVAAPTVAGDIMAAQTAATAPGAFAPGSLATAPMASPIPMETSLTTLGGNATIPAVGSAAGGGFRGGINALGRAAAKTGTWMGEHPAMTFAGMYGLGSIIDAAGRDSGGSSRSGKSRSKGTSFDDYGDYERYAEYPDPNRLSTSEWQYVRRRKK